MVSLKDVASSAQVSVRTVGRVLNQQGYVNAQTRQRVMHAAVELGYRPNRLARSLRTGQSYQVNVIMGSVDQLHIEKLAAFQQCLEGAGYAVSVLFADVEKLAVQNIIANGPAAAALFAQASAHVSAWFGALQQAQIPAIVIDPATPLPAAVYVDRREGVRTAVQFLVDKGYAHIAYLGPNDPTRCDGYTAALAACARQPLWVPCTCSSTGNVDQFDQGYAGLQHLLTMTPRPDAVQVFSDVMAMGVLAAAHDHALRIPADLAVIGFDDRPMARYAHPALTTVAQPNHAVGVAAAEMLLAAIHNGEAVGVRTIKAKLVERAST